MTAASPLTVSLEVALRTVRRFARTPQVLVVATVQGILFLLMFRAVFGGAIRVGDLSYVDFLVPGFLVALLLFQNTAVGVAEDVAEGLFDRLRSLPVSHLAVLGGRALADTGVAAWTVLTTLLVGLAVGFRPELDAAALLGAAGLLALYAFAFTWVFVAVGLVAGSAQAAQGLSLLFVPVSFLSSAYVAVDTMPASVRWFAEHQPLTPMIDAVRALLTGGDAGSAIGTSIAWSLALIAVFAAASLALYRRS